MNSTAMLFVKLFRKDGGDNTGTQQKWRNIFAVAGIPWANKRKETWPHQSLLHYILRRTTQGAYEQFLTLFLVGVKISKVLQHKHYHICIQMHMYKLVIPIQYMNIYSSSERYNNW